MSEFQKRNPDQSSEFALIKRRLMDRMAKYGTLRSFEPLDPVWASEVYHIPVLPYAFPLAVVPGHEKDASWWFRKVNKIAGIPEEIQKGDSVIALLFVFHGKKENDLEFRIRPVLVSDLWQTKEDLLAWGWGPSELTGKPSDENHYDYARTALYKGTFNDVGTELYNRYAVEALLS